MTWFALYITLAWMLRLAMIPVILRRQLAPGASIAWLGIIFLHPYIGLLLYLLLGETRLGPHRVQRHREIVALFRKRTAHVSADSLHIPPRYEPMVLQAEKISGLPVLPDNDVEFLNDSAELVRRLVSDIDAAQHHVHLLYYIFADDATGQAIADALVRAAKRGIPTRLLIDAVASRAILKHGALAARLTAAGVFVATALPVHFIQRRLPRMDLRNHRKLAVIDDAIGYLGSHNLINPDYGGRCGGPWVDLTGRTTGPIVSELAALFAEDWAFETEQLLPLPSRLQSSTDNIEIANNCPMQLVPTGPTEPDATYRRVLLAAVQAARHKLTLTTPYFVPDEPTLVSLMMAADRGVDVRLLLPLKPDHTLTAAAGRAHYSKLMAAGVHIHLYRPGLLHSKTVTVDDDLALFGSANLDVRSFNLNFETTLLLYGRSPTERLRAIQEKYLTGSTPLNPDLWNQRSLIKRYTDSAISLLSPLL